MHTCKDDNTLEQEHYINIRKLTVGQDSPAGSEVDSSADLPEVDEDDDDEEPSCEEQRL